MTGEELVKKEFGAVLELEEEDGNGDNIQLSARGNYLRISCEEPCSGSTETGFGAMASFTATREQAAQIVAFIRNWLESK